ncbi:hypothetical protein K7432_009580 [Basidiobolus ranarum]|uniref:Uncharacterized protein n=1 Tax=Basidiobolus ranarum TaxID=34480 RepID=A0ABR2VXM0_9FUNG
MEYERKGSQNTRRSLQTAAYDSHAVTKDHLELVEQKVHTECNRKSCEEITGKQSKGRNLKFWSACDALY